MIIDISPGWINWHRRLSYYRGEINRHFSAAAAVHVWWRPLVCRALIDLPVIFFETCSPMKCRASGRCFKTRISQSCYLIPSDELQPGPSSAQRESTPHELLPNIISAISPLSRTSEHGKKVELEINTSEYHGRGFQTGGFIFPALPSLSLYIPAEFLTHLRVKLGSSSSITIQIIHCEL